MTRNVHDQFAKAWMQELLVDFGEVDTLWLHLFSRDVVQAQAAREILALRENYPYKHQTIEHPAIPNSNPIDRLRLPPTRSSSAG